jgi:hypothetical protein
MQINAFLLHQETQGYNTMQGTRVTLQQHGLAANASITLLLNRQSSCCISTDFICADWLLTKCSTQPNPQF